MCLKGKLKHILGPPNKFFFLENALKKRLNIFSNFFFYLKVQSRNLRKYSVGFFLTFSKKKRYLPDPVYTNDSKQSRMRKRSDKINCQKLMGIEEYYGPG